LVSAFGAVPSQAENEPLTGANETLFGEVQLDKGLPATAADSNKLYDELDFQRACQAYVWALPIVSFAEWQHANSQIAH